MDGEPVRILLAEDDEAHALIVLRCLENHRIANKVQVVTDGEEALEYLFHKGRYSDIELAPTPDIIILDLRMPRVDGLEVLRIVKTDPDLHTIPVVILTTSAAEADIAKAYDYHANSYLVKPIGFEKFREMMDALGFYWFVWNKSPKES